MEYYEEQSIWGPCQNGGCQMVKKEYLPIAGGLVCFLLLYLFLEAPFMTDRYVKNGLVFTFVVAAFSFCFGYWLLIWKPKSSKIPVVLGMVLIVYYLCVALFIFMIVSGSPPI